MTNTVSVRYLILGLLIRKPMSGYNIKRSLESLSWLIDVPSFGSLYPALHGLLEDGLVTVKVVSNQDKPPRKDYSITETGRQVLQEWMGQPASPGASLRAFVMRLILSSHLSHAGLLAHLGRRRAKVAACHLALERAGETTGESVDLGERLTLDYGLVLANAELAWLDRTLTWLSQPSPSVEEDTQHRFATSAA